MRMAATVGRVRVTRWGQGDISDKNSENKRRRTGDVISLVNQCRICCIVMPSSNLKSLHNPKSLYNMQVLLVKVLFLPSIGYNKKTTVHLTMRSTQAPVLTSVQSIGTKWSFVQWWCEGHTACLSVCLSVCLSQWVMMHSLGKKNSNG